MMRASRQYVGCHLYNGVKKEEITAPTVSIHSDPRAVREAHKDPLISVYRISGRWTGYGYEVLDRVITAIDAKKIRKILKKIDARKKAPSTPLTPEKKIERWTRRLDKFTDCGLDIAKQIAQEKIDYEWDRVERAATAEVRGSRIPAWHRAAERKYDRAGDDISVLLSPITDSEHAHAILAASRRHNNSDYEIKLDEAHDLAEIGEISQDDVRDYARENATYR